MSDATAQPPESAQDDQAAMADAIEDIGLAVATGLVPFLGQAINIYDTVECLIRLHNSTAETDKMEAKFDLVLALVGWIPGAGGGVKKTLRIVNKNPDRFAPILFDVLRLICDKIGIKTSPEALLDELFNVAGLKSQLGTVQSAIEGSWLYEEMPLAGQQVVSAAMMTVRSNLPAMVMLVTKKLAHWKTKQRNNSAHVVGTESKAKPTEPKPDKKKEEVARSGRNAPSTTQTHGTLNTQVGTQALEELTRSLTGIVGEHITDYFLYEKFQWGSGWKKHDEGAEGRWNEQPDKTRPGKLNDRSEMNKLFALKARGTGIDGVWRVPAGNPHNGGKPYAIVESKASVVKKAPKNPKGKPRIDSKLGVAGRVKEAVLPKPDELLEPDTSEGTAPSGGGGKPGGKPSGGGKPKGGAKRTVQNQSAPQNSSALAATPPASNTSIVQMSHVWIEKNIRNAIKPGSVPDARTIITDIEAYGAKVYSRHLFYTPFYLPSAALHEKALLENEPGKHEKHTDHDIPPTHRHDESDVKAAVNRKHTKLGLPLEP